MNPPQKSHRAIDLTGPATSEMKPSERVGSRDRSALAGFAVEFFLVATWRFRFED